MILKMAPLTIFLVVAVALQGCAARNSEERLLVQEKTLKEDYRLPEGFDAVDYKLKIVPDFQQFTFDAELILTVIPVLPNLKTITLHAHEDLAIEQTDITIQRGVDNVPLPSPIMRNNTNDFLVLTIGDNFVVNQLYTITFSKYTGKIREAMNGFYRSSYVEGNTVKWLGTTQFQPVHARKVFPCLDEPKYKAKFTLTIDRPTSYSPSLSNMPIDTSQVLAPSGLTREVFLTTPIMSTYLLAFIVSEFIPAAKTLETDTNQFGVYARPGASDQGQYAFTTGQALVKSMSLFTGIDYYSMDPNLKKMDQVGLPDFSAGAMENWGLLTYREAYVMIHGTESSVKYKQQVNAILAHEIAHMWFGDYVTCHWWSDTWLNEGFARFFQYRLPDMVEELDMATQFVPAQVHTAFLVDTSVSSDPLTNDNVNTPAQVSGHFGSITYNKGASVLRMIENWIGAETFQKALHEYLEKMKFKPSYPKDLFDSLQLQANADGSLVAYPGHNVTAVMSSWTTQAGYPVLQVNINYETGSVDLEQRRMVMFGEDIPDNIYSIPITFASASKPDFTNTKPVQIMNTNKLTISKNNTGHEWVVFNTQQTGFYRVNYDAHSWEMLSETLKGEDRTKIHTLNRAQIVDDVLNLAKENVTDYQTALEVIQFLELESDYAPWSAAIANFNVLRRRFSAIPETLKNIDKHILVLLDHVTTELGLTEKATDSHLTKLFRGTALSFACNLGHKACIDDASDQFEKMIATSNTSINANLREHVYCSALRNGGATHFDRLWEKYLRGNVVNEQIVILGALGCTANEESLKKFLAQTIAPEKPIRDQDLMTAFNSALTGNDENVEIVFQFFKDNLERIEEVYGSNTQTAINNMIGRMKGTQLQRVVAFLKSSLSSSGVSSGLSAVADVALNNEWALFHRETIHSWVESKYNGASAIVSSFALLVSMLALLINNN